MVPSNSSFSCSVSDSKSDYRDSTLFPRGSGEPVCSHHSLFKGLWGLWLLLAGQKRVLFILLPAGQQKTTILTTVKINLFHPLFMKDFSCCHGCSERVNRRASQALSFDLSGSPSQCCCRRSVCSALPEQSLSGALLSSHIKLLWIGRMLWAFGFTSAALIRSLCTWKGENKLLAQRSPSTRMKYHWGHFLLFLSRWVCSTNN